MGAKLWRPGALEGRRGAVGDPTTALPRPASRAPRLDLPWRGLAPSPRWAPLGGSGCSARASRDRPEDGLQGGRAAAGRGPLYGAGGR